MVVVILTTMIFLFDKLSELYNTHGPFATVIHGCAPGVDTQAEIWAASYGCKVLGFRAEWQRWGKAAGPMRNGRMIREGKPDLVIAFPGGRGTNNMKKQARENNIKVILIKMVRVCHKCALEFRYIFCTSMI